MSNKSYCKEKGLSYKAITNYAYRHNISLEEAIKLYENDEVMATRYIIDGLSLREYCKVHGFNYKNVQAIKHKHKDLSYEEILKRYSEGRILPRSYNIGGMSLRKYCKELGIENKYRCILMYKRNKNCTIEEAIERYKI